MNDISLQQSLKKSNFYTRKRSIKFWIITHLLIPKTGRKYIYMCFNYLKWADDFVDNPLIDKADKLKFIKYQLHLLMILSKGEKTELKFNEEYLLYNFINYAISVNNYNLIYEVKQSLESICMDADRLINNKLFSSDELNQYLQKVVKPVFNLTYYFILQSNKIQNSGNYIGKFVWMVLILRDFSEDVDAGYINISKEEIEKYNLNIYDLKNDCNRIVWMKDKFSEYINVLNEDTLIFKSMPLKVKLFWIPIYPLMIYELIKIKIYNYHFGEKQKKDFIKELSLYSESFIISLKFFVKVFI